MFDPVIAPSGTLLGLLQRGRGDGTLHALTAPRAEALAALNHCVLRDPRHDWQVENRSLYYARLYLDLNGELDEIEQHLFDAEDVLDTDESRTGLALAVLGHLASYGRRDALALLRRYAASGANWAWALDELALRDDDAGLRALAAPVLARFPDRRRGRGRAGRRRARRLRAPALAAVGRGSARIDRHARACRPGDRAPSTAGSARCDPPGPARAGACRPCSSGPSRASNAAPRCTCPAARCLAAVAGPEDRPEIVRGRPRRHRRSPLHGACAISPTAMIPDALDLIEAAVVDRLGGRRARPPSTPSNGCAASPPSTGPAAGPTGPTPLGAAAGRMLACRGGAQDTRPGPRRAARGRTGRGARRADPVDPRRRRRPARHRLRRPRAAPRLPRDRLLPSARPRRPRPRRHRPLLRRRASPSSASGTARRPPASSPPGTPRPATPGSSSSCAGSPPIRPRRPRSRRPYAAGSHPRTRCLNRSRRCTQGGGTAAG